MASSKGQSLASSLASTTSGRYDKHTNGVSCSLLALSFSLVSAICHISGLRLMHRPLSLWGSFFCYFQGPLLCPVGFLNPAHTSKQFPSEYLLYKSPSPAFNLFPKICFLHYLKKIQIKKPLTTPSDLKIISGTLDILRSTELLSLWLRELQVLKSY